MHKRSRRVEGAVRCCQGIDRPNGVPVRRGQWKFVCCATFDDPKVSVSSVHPAHMNCAVCARRMILLERPVPEIGTPGSESRDVETWSRWRFEPTRITKRAESGIAFTYRCARHPLTLQLQEPCRLVYAISGLARILPLTGGRMRSPMPRRNRSPTPSGGGLQGCSSA